MSVTINGNGNIVSQVVQATSITPVTNNTATYATTGLTANITPFSTSSKILVTVTLPILFGSSNNISVGVRINRGGTIVYSNFIGNNVAGIVQQYATNNFSFLDSPATTSSTTYTIEFATLNSASIFGSTIVMNQNYTNTGVLLLQEISGS